MLQSEGVQLEIGVAHQLRLDACLCRLGPEQTPEPDSQSAHSLKPPIVPGSGFVSCFPVPLKLLQGAAEPEHSFATLQGRSGAQQQKDA